jgi:hypothetical protein
MDVNVGQHGKVSIATNKQTNKTTAYELATTILHQSKNALTCCALWPLEPDGCSQSSRDAVEL